MDFENWILNFRLMQTRMKIIFILLFFVWATVGVWISLSLA